MIKSQGSTSSNGEVQNQRQEHHIHVMLAMSDFLVLRFVVLYLQFSESFEL